MKLLSPDELPAMDPAKTAHVAVHVQRGFFNPESSYRPSEKERQPWVDSVAARIDVVAAHLTAVAVPTLWGVMDHESMNRDSPDLHIVHPRQGDAVIAHRNSSVLNSRKVMDWLKARGVDTLVISGGYLSECVADTVEQARRRKMKVVVLGDCLVDNGTDIDLTRLFSRKSDPNPIRFATAETVLAKLGVDSPKLPKPMPMPGQVISI